MPIGAVKWFDARKGFGFLQPDDLSEEILVHSPSMEEAGDGAPISPPAMRRVFRLGCASQAGVNPGL